MPAPKFLAGLPKPLLFALYGAVGGLLGALVFAEPLYHILTPPKAAAPDPQLAVAASEAVEVFVDGQNKFPVQITRARFDGPVTVRLEGLPAGVTAAPVTIPAGADKADVVVVGGSTARVVAAHPAKAVVEGEPDGKKVRAEAPVNFKVTDPPKPLADIVIVLDTSVSMQWALDELKDGIGQLTQSLSKARVDYRLALVTFRDRNDGGEKVTVVQFKGGPFTSDERAFRDEVGKIKVLIGTGVDSPQPCLEGITKASELEFRGKATKMMLVVTDNPPKVEPVTRLNDAVRDTANLLKSKELPLDAVHLVTWAGDKDRWYTPLLNGGKQAGRHFNIKEVVTGDQGFAALLDTLGAVVTAVAIAQNPASTPKVAEDAKKPELKSLQSGEGAAAGTEGKLVLRSGIWTGAIAALVCLFLLGGQHHYLRGSLPAVGGTVAGLLGGLVVGLVGGAAGQGLYLLVPSDSAYLGRAFQVFGWALLGGMAGPGLSLFVPNMKWTLGLAGGAIGGAVGCIGFIAVSAAAGDIVGRLVGGLVLGFCIGLMVAVAEAAFRRAWLEVKYGEREKITVTLGPEPVKVGSDAKACTVWARGAPPIALRFYVRDGQVICTDTASGRETPVADGFAKEVGTLTVTVRTGSGAAAPVPAKPRAAAPAPKVAPKPKAMSLDDEDDGFDLPMPVSKPAAAPLPPPVPPPAAPAPPPRPAPAAAKPPVPAAPPPRPAAPAPPPPRPVVIPPVAPAIKSTAKNPDACPGCARVIPGKPGARYCMMCDQTF